MNNSEQKAEGATQSQHGGNAVLPAVQYSISQKKVGDLYSAVHKDISDTRVALHRLMLEKNVDRRVADEIDDLMFQLHMKAPDSALLVFKKHGR